MPKNALSESPKFMLGEAAGAYIAAVDIIDNFEKTECTYLISGHYNIYTTLNEISPYLNREDLTFLQNYIKSDKFKAVSKQNYNMLFNFLDTARKSNYDMDIACKSLFQHVASIYNNAKHNWEFARVNYSAK